MSRPPAAAQPDPVTVAARDPGTGRNAVLAEALAGVDRHRTAVLLYIRTRWLLQRLVTRRVLDPRGGDLDATPPC